MEYGNFKYTVKESKESPFETVIEKGDITVAFTAADMVAEQLQCEKLIKELEGNVAVQEAKMTNILNNHEFVKDLTEEQRFTVHMFQEAYAYVQAAKSKLEEFKTQLAESRKEIVHIAKVLKLPIDLEIKRGAVDEAVAKITG